MCHLVDTHAHMDCRGGLLFTAEATGGGEQALLLRTRMPLHYSRNRGYERGGSSGGGLSAHSHSPYKDKSIWCEKMTHSGFEMT